MKIPRRTLFAGIMLTALLASILGCKRTATPSRVGYVMGPTNDIERVNESKLSDKRKKTLASSVLISTMLITKKRKFCSGSIIKTDDGIKVLTNYHCFAATTQNGQVSKEFLPEACTNTKVYFDFTRKNHANPVELQCEEGSLIGEHDGDIAVFSLTGNLPDSAKPLELWTKQKVPDNQPVFMIHHPDISENFEQVGSSPVNLPVAAITEKDCITQGDFSPEEWPLDQSLPYSLKHTCDLTHGSSGSALIDAESGKILGVNWGGIEIKYKNRKVTHNAATKGFYVLAFLNGEQDTIRAKSADIKAKIAQKEKNQGESGGKLENSDLIKGSCGVIAQSTPTFLFFLYLMLPMFLVVRFRKP